MLARAGTVFAGGFSLTSAQGSVSAGVSGLFGPASGFATGVLAGVTVVSTFDA